MVGKLLRRTIAGLAFLAVLLASGLYALLRASLPTMDGTVVVEELSAPVGVKFDALGIPTIDAKTREDAFLALGFASARERLFQMDLMRRQAGGRLAEIFGASLASADGLQRVAGFEQVARAILQRLPATQRAALTAYAAGVNRAIATLGALPVEFALLGYKPEPWRPENSLLTVLGMEENLGWTGDIERMNTAMEAALPPEVYSFFTPETDRYTERLLAGEAPRRGPPRLPAKELAALLGEGSQDERRTVGLVDAALPHGSNGWAAGAAKTWDGRAILASDMHLQLQVPNVWYRAELRYGKTRLGGLTLPGVPMLLAGSNGRLAWSFTNIEGDFVDLVGLELDPADPGLYRTPQGYERFGEREEIVRVRGEADRRVKVATTRWGPVLPDRLLGKPVAVRWTALDPEATDLNLMELDSVSDVHAALDLFNRAGGPPLNALAADSRGNIGWTYSGKIPRRFGLDGSVSRSWADGSRGWQGYIPPQELPRVANPPSGFIVNANQRMTGREYPYPIGHDFDHGHRALRIAERLAAAERLTEREMFALQLDTRAEFYRYYQRLALSLPESDDPEDRKPRRELQAWDGAAERESLGFALLTEFRRVLLDELVGAFLAKCRASEPNFRLYRTAIDEPMQQILDARLPELLPKRERHSDWNAFLRDALRRARDALAASGQDSPRAWGEFNRVAIAHPFSSALPSLGKWLDMPREPVAGCPECVRAYAPGHGASERMVVSPGRESNGFLHMPGGQSGHRLSQHYGDQQRFWAEGRSLPFEAGETVGRLDLVPAEKSETPP